VAFGSSSDCSLTTTSDDDEMRVVGKAGVRSSFSARKRRVVSMNLKARADERFGWTYVAEVAGSCKVDNGDNHNVVLNLSPLSMSASSLSSRGSAGWEENEKAMSIGKFESLI